MHRVITRLGSVRMCLDDAIVLNRRTPSLHVVSIQALLVKLKEYDLKLARGKTIIGAVRVTFLGLSISSAQG